MVSEKKIGSDTETGPWFQLPVPKPGFGGRLLDTVFLLEDPGQQNSTLQALENFIYAYNLGSFSEGTIHLKVHFELW